MDAIKYAIGHHSKDGCIAIEFRMPCLNVFLKRTCFLASTDLTDCNNFAIMDASAIGHHGKEYGSCQKEEAEHPQHDSIQGMGKNLKKKDS